MSGFKAWRVGVKLIAGFLAVAAIAAVIGGLGLQSTSQVNQMAMLMYAQEVAGIRHAAQAQVRIVSAGRAARGALLASDKGARIGEIYSMRDHLDGARIETEKLHALMSDADGQSMVSDALQAIMGYADALEAFATRLESSGMVLDSLADLAQYEALLAQATGLGEMAELMVTGMVLNKQNTSAELANQTTTIFDQSLMRLSALTAVGALLAIGLGMLLTRGLMRQLGGEPADVVQVVNAVAQGDLTTRVAIGRARPGSVMAAMAQMRQSLGGVVGRVHASSDSIAIGAHQIAVGNADLARRTDEQVASLTETASAMAQLSGTVASNASVSGQAANMALTARRSAEHGGEVVGAVVTTMDEISQASRRIVDIIALIDSIAFQTNILALNAAVEAARAGDQGRGFAVVATEVRGLAQKSAAAARDIKTLITNSTQKVDEGSRMVEQAGRAMSDIVQEVSQVADLIQEISHATVEQTEGITQINAAVAGLMQITEQNATLVEQSATAAEGLSHQASHLLDAMGIFNLGDSLERVGDTVVLEAQSLSQSAGEHSDWSEDQASFDQQRLPVTSVTTYQPALA